MKRWEIVSKEWVGNGSWLVEVRDNQSDLSLLRSMAYGFTTPSGARSAAKRVDPMKLIKHTEIVKLVQLGKHIGYRFVVSR